MKEYKMKPEFEERMKSLLGSDFPAFSEIIHHPPKNFIRCNTLKISCEELKKRLEKKWKVEQPFPGHEEIMLVEELMPGEIGKAEEHLLGYYYIQELSSMLSVIALNPAAGEFVLDLCASPGSKTTQMAAMMENSGNIIANDRDIGRIAILASNLERCGVANSVVTRMLGENLCERFFLQGIKFDKILVDAPCSGEGTMRSSPKTFIMWNKNIIRKLSKIQKNLIESAAKILKKGGVMVYSTCTHAPEENEEVVSFLLEKFPDFTLEESDLPIKCRAGILRWEEKTYNKNIERACRIYPHDNDTEGFFVAKFRRKT